MHPALLALREVELATAAQHIPPGAAVLELGAGNGWQAQELARAGHLVVALDVSRDGEDAAAHHPVILYDGSHLPLADSSVDVVFSSNVLEHVRDLPTLLHEMRRVLKPAGRAVHVVPNPVWRAWTMLARYPYLLLLLSRRRVLPSTSRVANDGGVNRPRSLQQALRLLRRAVVEPPHGEYSSAWKELHGYSSRAWQAKFAAAGWTVRVVQPAGVFYTGYGIFPGVGVMARQRVASFIGASCTILVVEPS